MRACATEFQVISIQHEIWQSLQTANLSNDLEKVALPPKKNSKKILKNSLRFGQRFLWCGLIILEIRSRLSVKFIKSEMH